MPEGSFAEIAVALTLWMPEIRTKIIKTKMTAERIGLSRMGYELSIVPLERDAQLVELAAELFREMSEIEPIIMAAIERKRRGHWLPRMVRNVSSVAFL